MVNRGAPLSAGSALIMGATRPGGADSHSMVAPIRSEIFCGTRPGWSAPTLGQPRDEAPPEPLNFGPEELAELAELSQGSLIK